MKILLFEGTQMLKTFLIIAMSSIISINTQAQINWPSTNSAIIKDPVIETRILDILQNMTLEEKVGQMIQAEIKFVTPDEAREFKLGSILNGGGSFPYNNKQAPITDWVKLADSYYDASKSSSSGIPLLWGTDAVHGHNNVIGATIFPHNIGLGAAANPDLIEEIGKATAKEVLATGIDWIFAPTVAVVRNDRWGRTYEGYSEDPSIVQKYAKKMVEGIQGKKNSILSDDHLLATAKHFIGDGGTTDGVDQGNNITSEENLLNIHGQGYVTALNAGVQTVMASFNSWKGSKVHGNKYLLTEVLKNQMKFDGFVIGDWNGHGQVDGCTNESCPHAINAGVDMIMVPEDWRAMYYNTIGQVRSNEISIDRINDAVTRILRVKIRSGLFERGKPSTRKYAGFQGMLAAKEHRAIARQAVRESLVLLKNKKNILPLDPQQKILVAGNGAHNIGKQSGGWTITWQGTGNSNSDFPNGDSILDGLKAASNNIEYNINGDFSVKPDVAIVVFGEEPYAEGQGDIDDLHYSFKYPSDLALIKKLKAQGIKVVSIFITGRALWMNPEINNSDAFVVAWLPGSEGAGIADVLLKKNDNINYDFKGRLSFSWPMFANQVELNYKDARYSPLFAYGYGLSYSQVDTLGDDLPETPFSNGNGNSNKDEIEVFAGRPIAPFKAYVFDSNSGTQALEAALGSNSSNSINIVAIDKEIQEDARKITFKSNTNKTVYFESIGLNNLSSFNEGILSIELKKDQANYSNLSIEVENQKFDITNFINSQAQGKWSTFTLPLKCLNDVGVDLSQLQKIFGISSNTEAIISFAKIKFIKKGNSTQACK